MLTVCGSVMILRNQIPPLMIEQIVSVDPVQLAAKEVAIYTDFAGELASLAATQILPYFRTAVAVENKGGSPSVGVATAFDPVTIADKAAEKIMREKIRSTFPEHGILGEEYGLHTGASGLTWVLDPIDGTRAFITGMPVWGCLIALFDGSEPVLGVMDQPFLHERYIGTGTEAYCVEARPTGVTSSANNKVAMKTRVCNELSDAVMMTTSPDMLKTKAEQSAFYQLADCVRMHRFGGDCYAYCMLARGFVDLVVEADLEAYDIQALIPIVQGAGGVVSNWQGDSARAGGRIVAAATPELHQQALAQLSVVQ